MLPQSSMRIWAFSGDDGSDFSSSGMDKLLQGL